MTLDRSAFDRLQSRSAIHDVILRWCRAIDRLDLAGIAACFHDDAIDDHVFYRGDIPGLLDCLARRHETIGFSMHSVSNVLIDFIDDDRAVVESYVHVVQRRASSQDTAQGASQVSDVYCRYVDRFERRGGGWRIAHRLLVIDSVRVSVEVEPQHRLPPPDSRNRGRRDPGDAIYRALAGQATDATLPPASESNSR